VIWPETYDPKTAAIYTPRRLTLPGAPFLLALALPALALWMAARTTARMRNN
jgi:hypothetical protein